MIQTDLPPRILLACLAILVGSCGALPVRPSPDDRTRSEQPGSTLVLRLEWQVIDEWGRCETWFEELIPGLGSRRWRSQVHDEDGHRIRAERYGSVRAWILVSSWPSTARALEQTGQPSPTALFRGWSELDSDFRGALPP